MNAVSIDSDPLSPMPTTNTVTTVYDAEGRVVSQRGATYPVDYAYDEFGNKVSMTTYRDINAAGDVTRWLRNEATGLVTNKVYADGKGPTYDYTTDGKLARRVWARGIVTTYSYNANGVLTNTVYSDCTPSVSLVYNRAGRQIEARDAAGITTFAYDTFGSLTNETVVGVAGTNTIERFYDSFGRDAGYALNGVRQSTLGYDLVTGRLATMLVAGSETPFTWSYLDGSDLKSSLAYPNGLTASWTYGNRGELLEVNNASPTSTISRYVYTYDAAGRRVGCDKSGSAFTTPDTYAYLYNTRSELTNATASVDATYRYGYDFDDIGNRKTSAERGTNSVYTANNLNQYTDVDDFAPQFDDDGNQTLVKTATGVWQVTYNGENRPILWTQGTNTISMSFDRMGRRVTKNNQHFIYNGYLQIANFHSTTTTSDYNYFVWDPTEPVATRPLVWNRNGDLSYYVFDGNKNVSEAIASNNDVAAHYEYAPFGALTVSRGASAEANPFRFSSEYAEDDTATVYYNYRHYEPVMGRWMSEDILGDIAGRNHYAFLENLISAVDHLGMYNEYIHFYLILWIARQVGYSSEDALSLAWGSQYPDTESWNAITWFFGPSIPKLHNINGFSPSRVKKYRCCLVEQYAACIKKAKEISDNRERRRVLFECGVLLHVIGDTYAHTMSDGTAYLPVIGHLFDGTAPDNPYTDIIKFTRYVEDVFSAFPKDAGVTTSKDRLIRLMRDWDYCLDKELWFPKREYTEIVKELIKEVYPRVDYAKLKMSLQKSNKDRDSQMRNSILPVLDNCYKRSGR